MKEGLGAFFDLIDFDPDKKMDERCNSFAQKAQQDMNWGLNKILFFLQFQKKEQKMVKSVLRL
jgi:hypothetical protein